MNSLQLSPPREPNDSNTKTYTKSTQQSRLYLRLIQDVPNVLDRATQTRPEWAKKGKRKRDQRWEMQWVKSGRSTVWSRTFCWGLAFFNRLVCGSCPTSEDVFVRLGSLRPQCDYILLGDRRFSLPPRRIHFSRKVHQPLRFPLCFIPFFFCTCQRRPS